MRLFIAISLPQEAVEFVSREVEDVKRKIKGLNIRFMPKENWHFTLVFLGEQNSDRLEKIKEVLKRTLNGATSPEVQFDKVMYGPLGRTPRMIWLTTTEDTSKNLDTIKRGLENELEKVGIKWQKPSFVKSFGRARERSPFRGHLTLARFEPFDKTPLDTLQQDSGQAAQDKQSKPQSRNILQDIEKKVDYKYRRITLHLMESVLKRSGAEYTSLLEINLGN